MIDIISALEARDKLNEKLNLKKDSALSFISDKIHDAIENEESEIVIDEYISLEVKEILKNKGYIVSFGSQCDSPYTTIKW